MSLATTSWSIFLQNKNQGGGVCGHCAGGGVPAQRLENKLKCCFDAVTLENKVFFIECVSSSTRPATSTIHHQLLYYRSLWCLPHWNEWQMKHLTSALLMMEARSWRHRCVCCQILTTRKLEGVLRSIRKLDLRSYVSQLDRNLSFLFSPMAVVVVVVVVVFLRSFLQVFFTFCFFLLGI